MRSGFSLVLSFAAFSFVAISPSSFAGNLPCDNARLDNDVYLVGTGHDSFNPFYRSPFGAVKSSQGAIQLRFRTCRNDVHSVKVRVWDSIEAREIWYPMTKEKTEQDPSIGAVDYWQLRLPIPAHPDILYYFFEMQDGGTKRWYVTSDRKFYVGGWGRYTAEWDPMHSYQLTVYDKDFQVTSWNKGALFYQILPERFRNGDRSNDPINGMEKVFGKPVRKMDWNQPLCDPRGQTCRHESDNQFYGGDLDGVIEKLDYLEKMGVEAIYLNPIFEAQTNHRYDTQDYYAVDKYLGYVETFKRLSSEAEKRGIKLVVDGVFNHGSADSPYFDLFNRFGQGGACQNPASPFRSWFYFPHRTKPPFDHNRPEVIMYCKDTQGHLNTTYESWDGYYEHPVYNTSNPALRQYFYSGPNSVAKYWLKSGASGWRLDVGGELDPGYAVNPRNTYWEEFRQAVKAVNPDAAIIGEQWGNASPWLIGNEWDSVMNYRFRSAVLSWMADGCNGSGCYNGVFEDEDSNPYSDSGAIGPITESMLSLRLKGIQENYPAPSWHAMLNLLGSHDTARVMFLLKKVSNNDPMMAHRKFQFLSLFQYTYPGAPMVYYGDEVGLATDSVWYQGRWRDDPYCRAPYPWADEGLSPDTGLLSHFEKLGQLRKASPAFKDGDFDVTLIDDTRRLFGFKRSKGNHKVWVVLNRNTAEIPLVMSLNDTIPDGTVLEDVLNGELFVVSGGRVNLGTIKGLWGRVLLPKSQKR